MKYLILGVLVVFSSLALCSEGVKISGSITQTIQPTLKCSARNLRNFFCAPAPSKQVMLLKIELSQKKQRLLHAAAQDSLLPKSSVSPTISYRNSDVSTPSRRQLGMGKVPVLDQGMHGSCVTFASSAALNAAMNQGDVISELCQLQLSSYLHDNGYAPGGWDGSFGSIVLAQMMQFGFVTKSTEAQYGCGSYNAYPAYETAPFDNITLENFHRISTKIPENIAWSPVLDVNDAFENFGSTDVLQQVKTILNKGDRLTFGVLLFNFDKGTVGAVGSHLATNDTWVLTPEFRQDLQSNLAFAGHEMIITGYDDDAVATDEQGRKYKGLLSLRNSWGEHAGNHGNFYISYEYFNTLVMEVQRIRSE